MHIRQGQGSSNKKRIRVDAGGKGGWYLGFFYNTQQFVAIIIFRIFFTKKINTTS